jgi:hypothetical protein
MSEHANFNEPFNLHIEEQNYIAWWDISYHAAYMLALPRIQAWLESAETLQQTATANGDFLNHYEQWQEGNYAEFLADPDGNLTHMQIMFLGISEKVWEYTNADTWFTFGKGNNEAADTAWDIAIYDAIQTVKQGKSA